MIGKELVNINVNTLSKNRRLPEMVGELSTISWNIIFFSEMRNALGTTPLASGHLFYRSVPPSLAAGTRILLQKAGRFQSGTDETSVLVN